jgi:hypothetical protein
MALSAPAYADKSFPIPSDRRTCQVTNATRAKEVIGQFYISNQGELFVQTKREMDERLPGHPFQPTGLVQKLKKEFGIFVRENAIIQDSGLEYYVVLPGRIEHNIFDFWLDGKVCKIFQDSAYPSPHVDEFGVVFQDELIRLATQAVNDGVIARPKLLPAKIQ